MRSYRCARLDGSSRILEIDQVSPGYTCGFSMFKDEHSDDVYVGGSTYALFLQVHGQLFLGTL